MKKLFTALLAVVSSVAFAATTVPVQLLNPTGSSSGQAIVSTGASSAPAWGGIGLNGIAAIAANTVLANATGSSAAPAAFAIPSCSTSASALNWITSSGFTCNTSINAATLSGNTIGTSGAAVPLLNGANTWSGMQTFTSTITPSQTAGVVGTTTNNSANAGSVGEYVTASGSAVSLTTATSTNIASISLTAGDWDVWGSVISTPAGSTVTTAIAAGISTISASLPGVPLYAETGSAAAGVPTGPQAPMQRLSLSGTTTVYLVMNAQFTTSTMTGSGFVSARRRR